MAVPASGELSLNKLYNELDDNNYAGTTVNSGVTLKDLSDGSVETINTANASADRPDGSAPHAMTEFYAYDHDKAAAPNTDPTGSWVNGYNQDIGQSATTNVTATPGQSSVYRILYSAPNSPTLTGTTYIYGDAGSFDNFQLAFEAVDTTPDNWSTLAAAGNQSNLGTTGTNPYWRMQKTSLVGIGSDILEVDMDINEPGLEDATFVWTLNWDIAGASCFKSGSKVTMSDYTEKNIEDVAIGESVLSFSSGSGTLSTATVVSGSNPMRAAMMKTSVRGYDSNGWANIEVLEHTTDHPFIRKDGTVASYNPDSTNKNYDMVKTVQQLAVGDIMVMVSGSSTVDATVVTLEEEWDFGSDGNGTPTWDLDVEDDDIYFVNGVAVHNKK
jgi:hypothetical protein